MKEKKKIILGIILTIILVAFAFAINYLLAGKKEENLSLVADPELKRAMTYEQFEDGDEDVEGTDNVKFSAFFLRDLDGDGYAEKIKGTCKEIGSQDTLYMEVIVQTEGYLKDGVITINGNNFNLQTAIPKDNEIKNNYISKNTTSIELENLNSGTQKLLTGVINAKIGKNINDYSKDDNKVILTGTYVAEDGTETEITKEITLETDWYGTTVATITSRDQTYYDILNRIDEENENLTLVFSVNTEETKEQLNINSNVVKGTLPELNGYSPIVVSLKNGVGELVYDQETREFTITKTSNVDENGNIISSISRYLYNTIQVVYPLEAYNTLGSESVTIKVPVSTYYTGYNNPNSEFMNPFKSNTASKTLVISYMPERDEITKLNIVAGKYVSSPYKHYFISKLKPLIIYNGISSEEKDDTYKVSWYYYQGTDRDAGEITLKETKNNEEKKVDTFIKSDLTEDSMEDITTNVGIYFSNADNFLGTDGEIKVYDEDTGVLVHTFISSDWNKYTSDNPYLYDIGIKHIKVVTSTSIQNQSIKVYNIKELDDNKIVEVYSREEFDNLKYIKSNLVGYLGESYIGSKTHQANYEEPYSIANISISNNMISTQSTEKGMNITIKTVENENINQMKWVNGTFLIKLPDEILDVKINRVNINDSSVKISSYEFIKNDNEKFIKIKTTNVNPRNYSITINADITADPRIATVTKPITLYAKNEYVDNYYYSGTDTYDIDSDLNVDELINVRSVNLKMIAPNSLITNQTISEYDNLGSVVVSPEIAELKAVYNNGDIEEQTVKVGVQLKNNYSSTISEILMIGKIPFEGNTYVLSGGDLGSEYSTTMTRDGIIIPTGLEENVTIYYSSNENPSKEITDSSNGWITKENVTDWTTIKSWLIDFGETRLNKGTEYTFYYTVNIPTDVDFNEVAYSHHGIYFALDTEEGKYKTQVEPNKIGVTMVYNYNMVLTKYQKDTDRLVGGATYLVSKLDEEGNIEESASAITNADGVLEMQNLYAGKVYEIKEIESPEEYELNEDVIKIIANINKENGTLSIEKLSGTTKEEIGITKNEGENYKANIAVEDEVKFNLNLTKYEEGTTSLLKEAKYRIIGEGLPDSGKILTTNANGEVTIKGLNVGEEYTLEETKAPVGYYIDNEAIKFTITNNEGIYEINVAEGTTKETSIVTEEGIPTVNLVLEDEKIPTYNLEITKIKHVTNVVEGNGTGNQTPEETTYLEGAKFKLYKGEKEIGEYITDANGKITIEGLYQYEEEKEVDQTYTLKETLTPEGYAKVKDIIFKVQLNNEGVLEFKETITEGQTAKKYTSDSTKVNVIVEDSPSFKLIKKDGETGELLSNTKFAIYNVDDGEVPARNSKGEIIGTKERIKGREYYVVTTDANGEITLDLPEGMYKAREVEADEKYDISAGTYYFGIGASRELEKIMTPQYATSFGGEYYDYISSVAATEDGGYIVGGEFYSSSITIGDYTLTHNGSTDSADAFLIKYDSNGNVEWATSLGGTSGDYINSVAETEDGGYIAVGDFQSSNITVGDYTLTSNGSNDAFLIKYDNNGNVEWATSFGGSYDEEITSVAATEDGGCIVGGFFYNSSITIGEYTLTNKGNSDVFLIKYDRNNAVEWVKSFGGTNSDSIRSVAVTEDGGFIVGGRFASSTITIGDYTLNNGSTGYNDAFLIKYDSNNVVEWATSFGGTSQDYINSVAATEYGGYIVGGYFYSSTITVGEYTLNNKGNDDAFLIKYDNNGNVEWATSFGGRRSGETINSVAATEDGGYIVGGCFADSTIIVGDYTLTNNYTDYVDSFLIKYDSNNVVEWATSVGGTKTEIINSVAATEDGGYIVGGQFGSSTIKVGEYTLSSNGGSDAFLIKYHPKEIPSINVRNAIAFGGTSRDNITSVAATEDGGYIVGGYFVGRTVTVGEYTLSSKGGSDAFLIKYDSAGNGEWVRTVGGNNADSIKAVVATEDGGYLAGGCFSSGSIKVGEYTLTNTSYGGDEAFLIKYDSNGNVEYATSFKGIKDDSINSLAETKDGGYIVGGYFNSRTIALGDYTLTNNGSTIVADAFLIKYDNNGNVKWATSLGGEDDDYIKSVAAMEDGGYIVGGYFESSSIKVGDYTLTKNGSNSNDNAFLIKYDNNGNVKWATSLGGEDGDYIESVAAMEDGGYIAGGYFAGSSITIGDYTLKNKGNTDYADTLLIKYDSNGNVEWATAFGGTSNDYINSVAATKDGGCIVGGVFASGSLTVGAYTLTMEESNYNSDTFLIKYDSNGNVEWATSFGGESTDRINSVAATEDGGYIAGGYYSSISITIGDYTFTNKGVLDGFFAKINATYGGQDVQELEVKNVRKEYKIRTDIEEIDGVKGGTISGEDSSAYEKVKHGDSSTKEIIMTPDTGYEIIGIKVNGEDYLFEPLNDGSYKMPQFDNVTENKNIVVSFAEIDNKFTINKVDSVSNEPLEGAVFKLDQIEEREEPDETAIIGNLTDNGTTYTKYYPDTTNEIVGVQGDLTNNGSYYFVQNSSGELVPTNSLMWQIGNVDGATTGVQNVTANSYIPINLNELSGKYLVVVNARISSQSSYDYGYATVTSATTAPSYGATSGRFMYISGTKENTDYTSEPLEGGSTYYLHLGYRKNGNTDTGEDQVVINSIKVYPAIEENNTYNFIEEDSVYKSSNQGVDSTVCNSYVPIDLTNYSGKYYLTVNAEISSQSSDYGYATITSDTTAPEYDSSIGRFIYVSGTTSAQDYSIELDGGSMYYLHLGYYKNESTSNETDTFTINDISISLSGSELYHSEEIRTNSQGKAITNVPFGKYAITEIKTPENYEIISPSTIVEFRNEANATHEYTIENRKIANVIVHHYIKGTTDKVAEDEHLSGSQGLEYISSPKLDLSKYKLEEVNGELVLPSNMTGIYTYDDIEVNYYYVPREVPLVVHHYIEGTNDSVPLREDGVAEDINSEGNVGDTYTTEAVDENLLDPKYELVAEPDNKDGTYQYDEVVVIYNYQLKNSIGYVVHHVDKSTGEKIAEDEVVSGGKYGDSYTTSPSTNIPPNYTYDSRSDNWEGTLVDTLTEITYYYKATTEQKTLDVSKTSTTTLVSEKNQVVDYKISYSGTIDSYIGKAKVKIVDNLPYEIDESLSNINGGIYDSSNKTITWEENYVGINTYEDGPYYIDMVKNISVVYKDIDLTAEEIANNIDGYLITYDGDTEHERLDTDSVEVPQEIKGKIIIKYLDQKTNEEISEDVTHSARIGTNFDIISDAKNIDGYELTIEPQDKTGQYTELDQIFAYKYGKKVNYSVEYYYDGVKDDSKTERIESVEYKIINTYQDKVIEGYVLDKVEKLPLVIDSEEENIIKVYYKKDNFNYSVEYYYDGVKDESKTEAASAEFESVINTYEDKVIDGYKLDKEVGLPLTITSDANRNVVKVYYVKDSFEYSVEYYYDGVKDDALTETNTAEFESRIETYTDKLKFGYVFSRSEKLPLIITSDPSRNIIKIFYISNSTQTKEVFYNIEYYKDGEIVENDTEKITNTVQILEPDTLVVNLDGINRIDKYQGYKFDRTDPSTIPNTIDSGSTIKVYYVKRNDLSYTVHYLDKFTNKEIKTSKLVENQTYLDEVLTENEIVEIPGYNYDSADKQVLIINVDNNNINLFYVKRNDLSYKVRYLDKDTNEEIKEQKLVENQMYQAEIMASSEVIPIPGYEFDSASSDTITIGYDESLNVIDLFYKKRTDLTYVVKYVDKDTNEEIATRKTEGGKALGDVVYSRDEIISINKYDYDSASAEELEIKADNNELIIYYIKKNGSVRVKYVDDIVGDELIPEDTISGKVDSEYKAKSKTIPGYVCIRDSGNTEGTFTEEIPEIIFYYREEAKVIIKYVDKKTNEEIDNSKVISGFIGKEYNLEDKGKEIAGYRYSDRTENISGEMTEEDIEVVYYYKKESKVIVKYINDYTNEVIGQEEETYIEGDSYRTNPKKIKGYDIDITREYDNSSGIVGREDIEVKYYYKEKATLVIEYVDEKGNKIVNDKEIDVHIGEAYEVDKVLIDGYNFRGMPDNYKGTIENKRTVVRLVYDKVYSDDSKADTTIPKTMDKNMTKIYIICGMVTVLIYSIVVIIRWKTSEKKNK